MGGGVKVRRVGFGGLVGGEVGGRVLRARCVAMRRDWRRCAVGRGVR